MKVMIVPIVIGALGTITNFNIKGLEDLEVQTTRQSFEDQVRTITKKGWFSDLELLEIHQKTLKQNYYTVPDTPSGVKQKQSNEKEPQISANKNTTLPNDTLTTRKKHYRNNKS